MPVATGIGRSGSECRSPSLLAEAACSSQGPGGLRRAREPCEVGRGVGVGPVPARVARPPAVALRDPAGAAPAVPYTEQPYQHGSFEYPE